MREGKKPQRILLLGSSGNVGRMVLYYWRKQLCLENTVVAQHRDCSRSDGLFWPLLMPDGGQLKKQNISTIVSLAGITPNIDVDLALNTALAENILKMAYASGVKRILLASSSAVYGSGQRYCEGDAVKPVNAYGVAKVEMEKACIPWREMGLEVCCLRIGNVLGADALTKNIVQKGKEEALTIDCFSDGNGPLRSYIGPKTLSEVLFTLATHQSSIPEVLNVASPRAVYMENLAEAASHAYIYRSAPANAHQKITLNCNRLESIHGFSNEDSEPQSMVLQWKEIINR